jgi:glucokinase
LDHRAGTVSPVNIPAWRDFPLRDRVAFVSTAAVCDLDHIVIGGGVAGAGAVLFGPVRAWTRRLGGLDFVTDLTITPAVLKEHAGLVGAAALVHREDRYMTTV